VRVLALRYGSGAGPWRPADEPRTPSVIEEASVPQIRDLTREEKLATNQAVFREVNERIRELASRLGSTYALELICECSDDTCTATISVAVEDYEFVRRSPARFLICPSHDVAQIEQIVGGGRGYEIVEKLGDAASLVADLDPRQRTKGGQ
jgi:hypothetical protein